MNWAIGTLHDLRINADRMLNALNELARIGATADGGVNRPTFSEAHLAARWWFREEIENAGLEFHTDGAGNHSAVLPVIPALTAGASVASEAWQSHTQQETLAPAPSAGVASGQRTPLAMTLLLGSHLDSVPNGGRFDGALGVMAAFEVLRTIKETGIQLRLNLEAIDFTDEEGTLVGLLGSAALAGRLHPDVLQNPRGGREALLAGMKRAGLSDESMLSAARPKSRWQGILNCTSNRASASNARA